MRTFVIAHNGIDRDDEAFDEPYLDVLAAVRKRFEVPTFAYQVSGEYAMIEHAAAAGAGDRDALILETLLAFKRAGASGILSYHALDAARLING